ncbi:MAG: FAD-binding oxidoreductase [Acidobacteriota bacterium]
MDKFVDKELTGWGCFRASRGHIYRPEKLKGIGAAIQGGEESSYIGRGLGRSYGDAALNQDGGVVLTERVNRFLSFEPNSGVLSCEAGVSLEEILRVFVPRGWFLPVTPGTKFVTIGGAVACDVHGKNHHQDGSLSNSVVDLELLLANGQQVRVSRDSNPDYFWATVGGMGLTGMILSVTLRLLRIETAFIRVQYQRTPNLDETMRLLEEEDQNYRYSVAWMDGLVAGRSLGRSILIRGNHATVDDLSPQQATQPLKPGHRRTLTVPTLVPGFVLNRFSIRAFNSLYYRRFVQDQVNSIIDYDRFFYPLDSLHKWNRLYGKRGFIQYQCVFPPETSGEALAEVLTRLSRSKIPPFLVVLKRFGAETGLLSFPMSGYTLALDIPMLGASLLSLLHELDQWVIRQGGRVYLAKDACLSAEAFREMYPRFSQWQRIKTEMDPQNLFSSDLSRRLGITGVAH